MYFNCIFMNKVLREKSFVGKMSFFLDTHVHAMFVFPESKIRKLTKNRLFLSSSSRVPRLPSFSVKISRNRINIDPGLTFDSIDDRSTNEIRYSPA